MFNEGHAAYMDGYGKSCFSYATETVKVATGFTATVSSTTGEAEVAGQAIKAKGFRPNRCGSWHGRLATLSILRVLVVPARLGIRASPLHRRRVSPSAL